ncbi:hypothetical protein STEG23_017450 [Scotinomys teguina]
MERLWSLMLLKEKRVRRQQMLQALVEFQFKAVNKQQTLTIIDAIRIVGVLHAITSKITRTVRVGKRTRGRKVLLKAKPNRDPMGVDHSIPKLLCKEK